MLVFYIYKVKIPIIALWLNFVVYILFMTFHITTIARLHFCHPEMQNSLCILLTLYINEPYCCII
jgi:hypothetical protein